MKEPLASPLASPLAVGAPGGLSASGSSGSAARSLVRGPGPGPGLPSDSGPSPSPRTSLHGHGPVKLAQLNGTSSTSATTTSASSSLGRQARMQALGQLASPSGSGPGSGPSSAPDSPRLGPASGSLTSSGAPSPLRPPRQLASSDSDESAMMRVDRGTYQHMFQDVVHIKTMLLKLKRVLQDAETLNPFESSLKNGLLHQLVQADDSGGNEDGKSANPEEEVLDLKRQMVLMKQQLEEKDRTIQLMQIQMRKYENVSDHSNENGPLSDTCNAATQTDRSRPVSAGPSILSSLPSDSNGSPLVSWTDTWGRRSRTPASGGTITESKASAASKVPTVISRNSRSLVPSHQRPGFGTSGDNSPTSIPQVKGSHRKTGTTLDSVPNFRRLPVVAAPRKTTLTQKH